MNHLIAVDRYVWPHEEMEEEETEEECSSCTEELDSAEEAQPDNAGDRALAAKVETNAKGKGGTARRG